jgi:hypothetical protein
MDFSKADYLDEALVAHEEISEQRSNTNHAIKMDPISEALADHGDTKSVFLRFDSKPSEELRRKRAEAIRRASWQLAYLKAREEHPWDDTPEGLPTKDGRMISAAAMADGVDDDSVTNYAMESLQSVNSSPPQPRASSARAAPVSAASGAVDPGAISSLFSAISHHEGTPRSRPEAPARAQRGAASAQEQGQREPLHQGFVFGSKLRVTPKEFYHQAGRPRSPRLTCSHPLLARSTPRFRPALASGRPSLPCSCRRSCPRILPANPPRESSQRPCTVP